MSAILRLTTGVVYVRSWSGSLTGEKLSIVAGTIATGTNALRVTGTLVDTGSAEFGGRVIVTSATSSTAGKRQFGFSAELNAGYTGAAVSEALRGTNLVAGTGINPFGIDTGGGNYDGGNVGVLGTAKATTTGYNYGVLAIAEGGNINVGLLGRADTSHATKKNIGVAGFAPNGGGGEHISGLFVGGANVTACFTTPFTEGSAVLVADNYTTTDDIFRASDNGVTVFKITDGGYSLYGGSAGGATTQAHFLKKVTAIADASATDVLTVTIPNANHSAAVRLMFLVTCAHADDAFESSRCASGMVVFSRIAGAVAVATAATIDDAAIATSGTATLTLAYNVSAVTGAASASNSFTIQVTIDDSGNKGSNQCVVVAELLNAEATGCTIA